MPLLERRMLSMQACPARGQWPMRFMVRIEAAPNAEAAASLMFCRFGLIVEPL